MYQTHKLVQIFLQNISDFASTLADAFKNVFPFLHFLRVGRLCTSLSPSSFPTDITFLSLYHTFSSVWLHGAHHVYQMWSHCANTSVETILFFHFHGFTFFYIIAVYVWVMVTYLLTLQGGAKKGIWKVLKILKTTGWKKILDRWSATSQVSWGII